MNHIKGYQLAIILYICRTFTVLTHKSGGGDLMVGIYAIMFSILIQFLLLIPAYFLYKRYNSTNIITISKDSSPTFAKFIALISSLYFLVIAFDTYTSFYSFMTNTVFPYADQLTIVLPIFLVVLYAVIRGINPLLRAAELIFPFTLIVLIMIIGFALKEVNLIYWRPILENPIKEVATNAFLIALRNAELITLVYLLDAVPTRKKSAVLNYIIGFSLIFEIRMIFILLVLGDYASIQLYPSYSLASLVGVSIFQRLDSIYTIIWVFMAFIKLALYLWLSIDVLKQTLPQKTHPFLLPIASILLLGATIWKNNIYTSQAFRIIYLTSTTLFVILLIIVPLSLLLLKLFQKRRVNV